MVVCNFISFGAVSECNFVFTWSMSDSFYLPCTFGDFTFLCLCCFCLVLHMELFWSAILCVSCKDVFDFISDLNSLCLSCLVFVCLFKQLAPGGRQGGWNSRQTNRNSVNSSLL